MNNIQRWMGVLLSATIPMAILQSTSTQNDLVASFYLLVTVLFGYRALQHRKASTILALCLAASLAVCTKGTIYIFLLPWSLFFIVRLIQSYRWRIWQPAILLILTMMLVNGPQWMRNIDTFGSPLAADETLKNEQLGVAPTVANLLKNVAMECKTPIPVVNDYLTKGVVVGHNLLGLSMDDARWNWRYSSSFEVSRFSMHEDQAGNLWHILLFLPAVLIVWWKGSSGMKWYALCVVGMWVVFSALLKWQEWHNRLHLPMFFLMVPVMVQAISTWKKVGQYVVMALFFLLCIPYLFFNQSRPQAGADNVWRHYSYHQYFINKPERLKTFLQLAAVVERNQVHSLGWATSGDAWEYPMWVILEDNLPEMRHVFVQNDSRAYERRSWHPEGIISNRNDIALLQNCVYNGVAYYRTYSNGEWSFFLPVRHP